MDSKQQAAVPQEFKDGLHEVDQLFCNHNGSKRYICASRADATHGLWIVACSDGISQYWTREFTYQDILKMKTSQQNRDSWADYFHRFRQSFLSDTVYVTESNGAVTVTTYCFVNGQQESYIHKLNIASAKDIPHKISALMFQLLESVKQIPPLQEEMKALKKEIKKCQEELEMLRENNDSQWEIVKGAHVKPKPKDKTKGKRKPGFSLVNPTVKRHVAKGAKIGD